MDLAINISNSEKEMLCVTDIKKAIRALPEEGGDWTVDNPQQVVIGLENILIRLNDALALQKTKVSCTNCSGVNVYTSRDDMSMQKELNELFGEWEKGSTDKDKELFNRDGFYPGYNVQDIKVLFVGREACYMAKKNYIETMYANFRNNKIEGWTINQYPFQRRQAYIAYGILNGWPDWKKVPTASEICAKVGEEDGISWAFINMSKLSNETGDWRTDCNRYWPFVNDDKNKKMLCKQIKKLKPDVIIGANVPELVRVLNYGEPDTRVDACYYYKATDEFPPFLNCYHFAAIKKDRECFYEAVRSVTSNHPVSKFSYSDNLKVRESYVLPCSH